MGWFEIVGRSQMVTGNSAIWYSAYKFLLAFHSNYVPILHRFWDIACAITGDLNVRLDRPDDPLNQQLVALLEAFGRQQHVDQQVEEEYSTLSLHAPVCSRLVLKYQTSESLTID